MIKNICTSILLFWLVLKCLLVAIKENLTGLSNGLTGRSKNLDPTGNPIGRSTRPVSISGTSHCNCEELSFFNGVCRRKCFVLISAKKMDSESCKKRRVK